MSRSHPLWSSFLRGRTGSVGMTFALSFIPALLATGAAVDFSRAVAQRTILQQATDATTLATAHTFLSPSSTNSSLTTFAQAYLSGLMNGATVTSVAISQNSTKVCISATITVPTAVMKIVNLTTVPVSANACSQTGQTYEIALALDNSSSMSKSAGGQSKMDSLKTAAQKLVSILIPSGTTNPKAAISIVPFTSMVNVGTSQQAAFLDKAGTSSIHWQNFHRPTGKNLFVPTTKFDLFTGMNASWGGCVEERPVPYVTTDTAATTKTPDTMFVPYLAPDDPGDLNSSGYACYPTGSSNCGKQLPPYIFTNSYLSDTGSSTSIGVCNKSNAYSDADTATTYAGDNQTNIYPGSGLTMVCKYKGTTPTSSSTLFSGVTSGPNLLCSSQALTPLTTDTSVLNTAINNMQANGSTSLVTGFMWGWRSISPVVNPFPTTSTAAIGPKNPKAYGYGPPTNNKILILMTDGFNSWTPLAANGTALNQFGSLYEGFGFYANNRIASYSSANGSVPGSTTCSGTTTTKDTYRCQMDNVTLEACTNAKKAGVTVYTIGFSVSSDPIDTQGLALLKACATDPSFYYPASDSTSIVTAFQQIAARIQNLRLSL